MTTSPTALGLIGGALGAAIAGALARNWRSSAAARESRRFAEYGDGRFGYRGDVGHRERPIYAGDRGYRERDEPDGAGGVREKIAGGAQELKDRAGDLVHGVRERIPSAAEPRSRRRRGSRGTRATDRKNGSRRATLRASTRRS